MQTETQRTITDLEQAQEPLLKWLVELKVTGPDEQRQAENLLISARYALKEANQRRMELTRPLDESKSRIIELFKPYTTRLEAGISQLTSELNRYHAYLIQIQQAEHARRMAEAAAQAAESAETGEIFELPDEHDVDVPIVPKTSRSDMGTVTYRDDFDIQIVDPDKVPRDLCDPSMSRIRARVKSGVRDIPGVLITKKTITVTRR